MRLYTFMIHISEVPGFDMLLRELGFKVKKATREELLELLHGVKKVHRKMALKTSPIKTIRPFNTNEWMVYNIFIPENKR